MIPDCVLAKVAMCKFVSTGNKSAHCSYFTVLRRPKTLIYEKNSDLGWVPLSSDFMAIDTVLTTELQNIHQPYHHISGD